MSIALTDVAIMLEGRWSINVIFYCEASSWCSVGDSIPAIISWAVGYQLRIVMHNVSAFRPVDSMSRFLASFHISRQQLRSALVLISDTYSKFWTVNVAVSRTGRSVVNTLWAHCRRWVMATRGNCLKHISGNTYYLSLSRTGKTRIREHQIFTLVSLEPSALGLGPRKSDASNHWTAWTPWATSLTCCPFGFCVQ